MTPIIDRMPQLLNTYRDELIPSQVQQIAEPSADRNGRGTNLCAGLQRFRGVAEYVVQHEPQAFRRELRAAAGARLRLLARHDAGEPIADSYVSMLSYKSLYDALAAGAWDVATALAERMGGRDEIETYHDHPFDYAMGYALKWFVLGDREQMTEWSARFSAECRKKGNANFRGYACVFEAILSGDQAEAEGGLRDIVAGHRKLSRGRGVFAGTEDEALCVWGLGLAKLCRRRGLPVGPVPPLIPADLLDD